MFEMHNVINNISKAQRPFRYIVDITILSDKQNRRFFATVANLPGYDIESGTDAIPSGLDISLPRNIKLGEFSLAIINDTDNSQYLYFTEWINKKIYRKDTTIAYNTTRPVYYLNDVDDYVGSAIVQLYKEDGTPSYKYQINDIYPNSLKGIDLSYKDSGILMEFNVGFTQLSEHNH